MPAGVAEAVLIRAIEPALMKEAMIEQRPVRNSHQLPNGPAKLCQALDIDRKLDGVDLCDARAPLFIAENVQVSSFRRKYGPMVTTPRIGITRAAALMLRFYLEGSVYVSRRENVAAD